MRNLVPTSGLIVPIGAVVLVALGYLAGNGGKLPAKPAEPMPAPVPNVQPGPSVSTVRASRLEIVDDGNRLQFAIVIEDGKPYAIVNDGGTGRRLDLIALARKLR